MAKSFFGIGSSGKPAIDTINSILGWAQYSDTQYTLSSPLVVSQGSEVALTNNAGSAITSQLPLGVDKMYNGTTNKLIPVKFGDGYLLRIDFGRYTTSQTGYGEVHLDIGGAQGKIITIPVDFPRGTGVSNAKPFTATEFVYSFGDFIANGGTLTYESVRGITSVYDIKFIITKVTDGK